MTALVYHGAGTIAWQDAAQPQLIEDTDAVVQVDTTTICGKDLHILKGGVPAMTGGRIIDFIKAYDVFARAGETGALKVVLSRSS